MNEIKRTPDIDENGLYFIPMGGSEQFGVNMNVYVSGGEYLIVDCGIGFPDERFPGTDVLLPDPGFLEDISDKIQGLVVTHAHEDHIGAVAYLWRRLKCPLYASPFTAQVLNRKLAEENNDDAEVRIVRPPENVDIGSFNLQFIPVTHSIPDTCSLLIETQHGCVLHSGDWNLDPSPVIGVPTNPDYFKRAGEKGILAYIGDSTNAGVPGRSGSEAEVEKGMEKEFTAAKGCVVVTIFSSNISRIRSIARASQKSGRSVCVVGRSLHQMLGAAKICGYMDDLPEFITEGDLASLPAQHTTIIATGSQGEHRSALAKISRGEFSNISVNKGDTVIFSARAIPGNERAINAVKNNLVAAGVEVVTPESSENVIHVSGHPYRDEIADMYDWVKPAGVIPVHGERLQLEAQADFARGCGIKHVVVPNNGSVIRISQQGLEIVDHIQTGLLALEQKRVISADHAAIRERRKLQYTGAVHVALVLDGRGEVVGAPKIEMIGLIDEDDAAERRIKNAVHDEVLSMIDNMSWEDRQDEAYVSEELRKAVRRFTLNVLGFKPNATVHVMRI